MDEELIPAGAVLIEQENGFAGRANAGTRTRGLDFHQRHEAVDFWFVRSEFGEDAAEAQGVFTECGAEPVVAGSGGVTFIENQIDDLEDGGKASGTVVGARNFERDLGFGESALGADDALGDGGLGDQEGASDFVGGETAE